MVRNENKGSVIICRSSENGIVVFIKGVLSKFVYGMKILSVA